MLCIIYINGIKWKIWLIKIKIPENIIDLIKRLMNLIEEKIVRITGLKKSDKPKWLLTPPLLRTARVNLSDKIEALLPRTIKRTVRVPFSTYGSNRPLSKSIGQHNLSIFKVFRFITIKRWVIMFNHYVPFVNVSPPHFN